MARKSSLAALKELSEISYTPLIDLSMLLLVTFLITYPLMEQGIHVNLPDGKADELQPSGFRTITVNIDGALFLDDKAISREELFEQMKTFRVVDPQGTVFVRADKNLKYGRVVDVMKTLHDARISRMALVTETSE